MRHIRFWLPLTLLGLAFVAFAACGDSDDAPAGTTAASPTGVSGEPPPTAIAFEGGRDPVEVSPGTEGAGLLVDVRAARHDEDALNAILEAEKNA